MSRNLFLGILILVMFPALYYVLLSTERSVVDFDVQVGQTVSSGLVAPVDFEVMLSDSEYMRARSSVAAGVPIYLRIDENVWPVLRSTLRSKLMEATRDTAFTEGVIDRVEGVYQRGVFDLDRVRDTYQGDKAVVIRDTLRTETGLFELNELQEVKSALEMILRDGGMPSIAVELLPVELRPNAVIDNEARNRAVSSVTSRISMLDTVIHAGDTLVGPGGVVTSRTKQYISALRRSETAIQSNTGVIHTTGRALLVLGLLALAILYVHDQMPGAWRSSRRFLLLGTIWLVSLGGTGVSWMLLRNLYDASLASLVSFGAVLTAIFFNRRDAYFLVMVFALMLAPTQMYPFSIALVTFVSGSLAARAGWDLRKRSSVPLSIVYAALGGLLAYLSVVLLDVGLVARRWWVSVLEIVFSPIIGVGAAMSLLFTFEKIFGVYTVLAIDEAASRHHPLLERLSDEAMGSWQHSQAVADLASEAAEAIEADISLAQAGGLFHDIGKLDDPGYFIENQSEGEGEVTNPHDEMDPYESAKKIISHVQKGVELARRHRVPSAVVDIIKQSHGTTASKYFYEKARSQAPAPDAVNIDAFRYPGPKPQSREAALVMLADSVESATKALSDTSSETLIATIRRIVAEREADGQLDDCSLTRANLRKIEETFAQVLRGRYHERVKDYPHGKSLPPDQRSSE
ncbi:HDIG domain-containing protein [Candidatus Fermentibacteria bacterium]|nr:HDIG domain-containing protein [Candidatus Fermentibacteria bacterium]